MLRHSLWIVGVSSITACFVFGRATESFAATESQAASPATEEVCVPKAIEDKVTTCPGGFKMGKFKQGRAKVGTSKKEKEEKKEAKPLGPSLGREFTQQLTESAFKRKREKKKIDILKQEVKLLQRLAEQTANDNPEKAEILKRIADAYKDFYDQLNYMARDLDEKIFLAEKKNKEEAKKLKAQQKKLDEMSREYRELAIKAYVEIRNGFPDYPDYDEILFAIAYEIDQLAGEIENKDKKASYRERARVFYQELIRNFPRSRFIPHAWMAFGEFYFHEARDVDRAAKAYEKVVEWGEENNPNYVIAMYYIAWCLFNTQEYQKTIDQFVKVIEYAKTNPENKEGAAVAKRSKMELVDAFSKIGNPSAAWQFFQKVGDASAHDMLIKLANLYYDEGHWADAIIVFHKLEALELENYLKNNGDELCEYQFKVTNAVISSRPKDEQVVEQKRQLSLYKKFKEEGNHDPAKVKKCSDETATLVWDQATHWHVEAVGSESSPGTKDRNTMELTIALYDTILETFPNLDELSIEGFDEKTRPTRYRVAYFKADLYWTMEDWNRCGPAFDAVVEMDPAGDLTPEAAYGAVLCYNKVYVQERGEADKSRTHKLKADANAQDETTCDAKCKKCKKKCPAKGEERDKCLAECGVGRIILKSRDLTELEQGILKSYDRYVCYVTEGEDLVKIKYRRARIYYEANMFAESAVLFKDIAVNNSDNELGVYAANLYLDCLNAIGAMVETPIPSCYDDLAAAVDLFIDTEKAPGKNLMKDEEFASQIKALKVGVLRKKAEALTARKRFRESAEVYLDIYRNYKGVYDDRGMCEVLFNTAINMESARLVMPAIKVREKMIELYPDCEHSKKAAWYIGANYHALQVFDLAANNYYSFAKKWSGEQEATDALQNAVTFYIGLADYDKAWTAVKLFENNYRVRQPEMAATVFFAAGFIYLNVLKETGDEKDREAVRKHYGKYLTTYSKAKALDEQIQAHVFIADTFWEKRKPDYVQAEKEYRKALAIYDAKAMEKVAVNSRKASMLIAAAKARFQVAERKFYEFTAIKFPEFRPEKEVPKTIQKWWDKKIGPEAVKYAAEVWKYRRIAARWGEMDRKDVKAEEKKEIANCQFEYWLEFKFKPWMEKKSKAMTDANAVFAAVVEMHVPEWEMAAAARAGDMQMEFMQALYDAPLPPAFKDDQELTDIYRSSMDEKADPFRQVAINLFEHCLNVSTKVRWFNDNSIRCEARLNKLDPLKYPISEEIRIQPENEMSFWATPEPILELETAEQKRDRELTTGAEAIAGASAKEDSSEEKE